MNVLKGNLRICSKNPLTGWYRNGFCMTNKEDHGNHTICAKVTKDFLLFSKSKGNDLITPRGNFKGLKEGDFWCLCAYRWLEAYNAGVAPPVYLEGSNYESLKIIPIEILMSYKL